MLRAVTQSTTDDRLWAFRFPALRDPGARSSLARQRHDGPQQPDPGKLAWYLLQAESINEAGQIGGYGTINGEIHAFLATPIAARPR